MIFSTLVNRIRIDELQTSLNHGYCRIFRFFPPFFPKGWKMFLVACAIGIWSHVRLDCARALNHGMITWRVLRTPRDQNTRVIDERTSTSRYHRNVIFFLSWDTRSSDRFRPPVGKNQSKMQRDEGNPFIVNENKRERAGRLDEKRRMMSRLLTKWSHRNYLAVGAYEENVKKKEL